MYLTESQKTTKLLTIKWNQKSLKKTEFAEILYHVCSKVQQ